MPGQAPYVPLLELLELGSLAEQRGGIAAFQRKIPIYIDRKYGAQTQENMRQVTGITARRTEQASPGNVALASIFDIASQRG